MSTGKFSNFIWRLMERMLSQIVALVVSVVLARLLMPEDYGVVSMVMIFIAFADILITSGLPSALIQKQNTEKIDFSSVFYCNLILSIIIYIVLFFTSPYISKFFKMPILTSVIRVLGIKVIIASISSVQLAYITKNMMFKKFFWVTLIGTVLSGAAGIFLAYSGKGVWALVFQQLIAVIVSTVLTFVFVKWRPSLAFSLQRLKSLFKYGWKILFEGVFETLTVQVRNLIIGKVYTSDDLGYYTKSQQFPNLIVNNITVAMSSILFPLMSKVQDDKEKVKGIMRFSTKISSYIVFPIVMGLAIVAEPFVRVVLTDKWLECVPYIQIYCITQVATIGMITRHDALKSIGRSDVFMYEHIIYRVVVLSILILVYKISVMAIALSLIAGTIIMSITVGITSKKFNGYRFREQLWDVLPIFLACVVMAVPVYFIGTLNFAPIVILALQVLAGFITYLIVSIIFKLEGYVYIRDMIKRFLHSRKETKNV